MGGSFTTLLSIAKYLSKEHSVTLSAPDLSAEWNTHIGHYPGLTLTQSADIKHKLNTFDAGVFHLPFCMDEMGRVALPKKALVVMEIMSRHPLPFKEEELGGFAKAIHTHEEHVSQLEKFFPKEHCHQLQVVNNIDFDLPFRKTRNIASIGAAAYKHDIEQALKMLFRTWYLKKYVVYSQEGAEGYNDQGRGIRWPIRYYLFRERMDYRGIEWDVKKLYSDFDCLFHVPTHGNGTSIVVSDALACGKTVVLSSLEAYRKAYSGITGIWFAEDLQYDLSKVLRDYDEEYFVKIKSDYKKVYDRNEVLKSWGSAITD